MATTHPADAAHADAAVVIVGTTLKNEAEDHDRTSLSLYADHEQLVRDEIEANPQTIVVLQNAGPLTIPWIKLHAARRSSRRSGGARKAAPRLARGAVFGDINPAGRLPYTVYASADQVPPQDEYDISRGFTYMYLRGESLFSFGHGLSYTTFRYGPLRLASTDITADSKVTAEVEIMNSGGRAGDEVAQLYVRAIDNKGTPGHDCNFAAFAGFTLHRANVPSCRCRSKPATWLTLTSPITPSASNRENTNCSSAVLRKTSAPEPSSELRQIPDRLETIANPYENHAPLAHISCTLLPAASHGRRNLFGVRSHWRR